MSKKTPKPDAKQLKLKKLAERQVDPEQLEQVTGGANMGRSSSRYCALG